MPVNLMNSFVQGSNDVKQFQQNVAEMPHIQEMVDLKAKEQNLDVQQKQLNVQKLQEAVKTDADFKSTLQQYYSKPENAEKPPSEAMYTLSKLAMAKDPKLGERFLEKASAMAVSESTVEQNKEKIATAKLDNMSRIVKTIDFNQPEQIQRLIMAQNIGGFNSDLFTQEVSSLGPEQAKTNFLQRIQTAKEATEERLASANLTKAENDAKKIDLEVQKNEALFRKWDEESKNRTTSENAKEAKDQQYWRKKVILESSTIYNDFLKDYNAARNRKVGGVPDPDVDGMNSAKSAYESKISGMNDKFSPEFERLNMEYTPYAIGKPKSEEATTNQFEIKAAKDFTPTADQTTTLANAMKALEQGADRAKVIQKLKDQGIKLGE